MYIPTENELKVEAILSDIEHIKEAIVELAELKAKVKAKEKIMKDHMKTLAQVMNDMDVDELPIDNVTLYRVKGYSYSKVNSFKEIKKKHPEILENFPDIVSTVTVKPYVKYEVKQ